MKVSTNWIVPPGQVVYVRAGRLLATRKLGAKCDDLQFDEIIVSSLDRDQATRLHTPKEI